MSIIKQPPDSGQFLNQCLSFDIEVNEQNVIYAIGAVFRDKRFLTEQGRIVNDAKLRELDDLASEARFVLGHNILGHDLPRLRKRAPFLHILNKPAVDTLFLSPLAFPENPYHRLVKDYKLVRDSINDPVEDALLAGKVFTEQWAAFARQSAIGSKAPLLYRGFLDKDAELGGTAAALGAMGINLSTDTELYQAFACLASPHACITAVKRIIDQLDKGSLARPPLAYVVAWLTVAGGNSVLPPWVKYHFPEVPTLLHQLRENPCNDPECQYCSNRHNPKFFLKNYFGFSEFREKPATKQGKSLQEEIVKAAARDNSIFAVLPTGGGKSLCYLLPALMRYQHRNLLTIIISPLQALMKDQVDNFSKQTGTKIAAALNGMLTMPERGEVLEGIRLGDVGILYVSPEQLRNYSFTQTIALREIGAWVFDEVHCLSKWGHDFRPDYLYSIRFIREFAIREKTGIPPLQCFTATAKKDVKAEIIDIIQSELGQRVRQFSGGHERANLCYEVWPVEKHEKNQTILDLLRTRFTENGSVVIYCATRKSTEQLAEFLRPEGYTAEAFHAGLDIALKKRVQENFINGHTPIICATNAFGMGIDKDDVRLVIHADIPGSLENYLQEAGRAGRDRQAADCVLIFTEQDIEGQFRLSSRSRLNQREIAQLLRGIRKAARGNESVVLTSGELLRMDEVDIDQEEFPDYDTRVRTAVSWLERTGYLSRNENNTRVFQGKPLVKNMEEAVKKISELGLSERQQQRWLAILTALIEQKPNQGFSADELAALSAFASTADDSRNETESQRVIRTLHDMAKEGLLSKETSLTAYIRYQVTHSSKKLLQRICALEADFLKLLQEAAPDAEIETLLVIDLRRINQQLVDQGYEDSTPHRLKLILHGLSRDGKGLAGQKGSVSLKAKGNNRFNIVLHRSWDTLSETVKLRQQAAHAALRVILGAVPPAAPASASLLVEFTQEQITNGFQKDLLLAPRLRDPLAAAERALTFMHEQNVISLQHGLAVFRQAMTITINPEARKRQYTKSDFAPLKTHYLERNFQIHVMNEYARQALGKLSAAMNLVASYFNDEKENFVKRFFPGKEKFLERATSEQSYLRIVDELKNDIQEKIVAAETEKNMLVLAGPGAGKTRVVAHRVAFLLRVKRVKARAILVLCFNRSAALELRRKLRDLVGNDMLGVTTLTFHGLALRLTGRSLVTAGRQREGDHIDFAEIIKNAIRMLKGETNILDAVAEHPHDALTDRFSHILVDEYQDIDADQYELVALLAGKTREDSSRKMTILAVGDDDQNIYRFRGANVDFIRRFRDDYQAEVCYLIENYRSSANIIAAANQLIAHNHDRMKTEHPVIINKARAELPPGGNQQLNDPLGQGKVQILKVEDSREQAFALLAEIWRMQRLDSSFSLAECAILAREWRELDTIRSVFAQAAVPVSLNWGKKSFPSLTRIREGAELLDYLREHHLETISLELLFTLLPEKSGNDNIWQKNLRSLLTEWQEETGNIPQPVSAVEDFLYEAMADQNRAGNLHNGIFLSTVHSVKGLEFDHVFILGQGWRQRQGPEMEEERRLYYVAMSRARETLRLFAIENNNPHASLLSGDFILARKIAKEAPINKIDILRYELLGMKEMFLDYAGLRPENHQARKALAHLRAGDLLNAAIHNDHVELADQSGITVARLAKSAEKKWAGRLRLIREIRVLAMVRRYRTDIQNQDFSSRCHGESWELPVVEITFTDDK